MTGVIAFNALRSLGASVAEAGTGETAIGWAVTGFAGCEGP